jgi:hypothetical protein
MEESAAYATAAVPVKGCPRCGSLAAPVPQSGSGQHYASLRCPACDYFYKWLAKPRPKEVLTMGGIARCTIVGVVGKYGVEVRYATSGTPCASLMLVVSERGSDGKVHDLYVPCEVWGKKAEAAGELEAGQLALFEGKLAKRRKGESWELVVSGFELTPVLAPQASVN